MGRYPQTGCSHANINLACAGWTRARCHVKQKSLRQVIHPRLRKDIYDRLVAYCARKGATHTSVIESAVSEYLDDSSDTALIMRRLDRNSRALDRLRRDQELLSEFISVWVRMWFAHTPQIPDSEKDLAQKTASKRHEQLLDFVSKRFSSGHRLVNDLVTDSVAASEELARAVADQTEG